MDLITTSRSKPPRSLLFRTNRRITASLLMIKHMEVCETRRTMKRNQFKPLDVPEVVKGGIYSSWDAATPSSLAGVPSKSSGKSPRVMELDVSDDLSQWGKTNPP